LLDVFADTPTREQHDQLSTSFMRDALRPLRGRRSRQQNTNLQKEIYTPTKLPLAAFPYSKFRKRSGTEFILLSTTMILPCGKSNRRSTSSTACGLSVWSNRSILPAEVPESLSLPRFRRQIRDS